MRRRVAVDDVVALLDDSRLPAPGCACPSDQDSTGSSRPSSDSMVMRACSCSPCRSGRGDVPGISAMIAWSFGRRASNSSATRGRPPVMSGLRPFARDRAMTSPGLIRPGRPRPTRVHRHRMGQGCRDNFAARLAVRIDHDLTSGFRSLPFRRRAPVDDDAGSCRWHRRSPRGPTCRQVRRTSPARLSAMIGMCRVPFRRAGSCPPRVARRRSEASRQ